MRANFIYSNLNPCGGGERFTLVTMKAVYEMGLEIDLTTLEQPNLSKLENAYGNDLASIAKKIKKINLLSMFDEQSIRQTLQQDNYDLIINTHGDLDPYFHSSLNANNMIVYCHYPSAKLFLENNNLDYLSYHLKIDRLPSISVSNQDTSNPIISFGNSSQLMSQIVESSGTETSIMSHSDYRNQYAIWVKKAFDSMIRNSFLMTNSNYSKAAIQKEYGTNNDILVLSPPVDVDTIISKIKIEQRFDSSLSSQVNYSDENGILVICRIEPSKRIENAIYLAKILKERKIKTKLNIAGSLEPFYQDYYHDLLQLISKLDLSDTVKLHTDVSFEELIELMKKSKIFFHPREGEHFGMSIVEAMSAGLIPIVPTVGGQSEFVPVEYQYKSLEDASQIVSQLLTNMSKEEMIKESIKMRDIAKNFSETNYKRQFQLIVSRMLYVQSNLRLSSHK
ncbi:glycosyltransferase [Candidatus Nitrosocosmicus franklandus]|uniref:Glycosyl transferase family 1 domain-containing protein n=1 Tax=Candidatus Nitrosocosmicus franklandianus TaxID=1798806 RepID=A0A484IB18_9ARCH|nr:glycosyltransferase [Candidatus Nitrosocosmicus franklandus]VFJ14338.1 conserved protein of unknown function [Candidatus Nitrosocosmicus franklandus]